MSDPELRRAEREVREAPDDARAWLRFVRALEQAGQAAPPDLADRAARVRSCARDDPGHALLQVGDEVWVDEATHPYIVGRWRGIVRAVHFEHDDVRGRAYLRFRVWPIPPPSPPGEEPETDLPWRITPLPHWRSRGLELDRTDRLELIARAPRPPRP